MQHLNDDRLPSIVVSPRQVLTLLSPSSPWELPVEHGVPSLNQVLEQKEVGDDRSTSQLRTTADLGFTDLIVLLHSLPRMRSGK